MLRARLPARARPIVAADTRDRQRRIDEEPRHRRGRGLADAGPIGRSSGEGAAPSCCLRERVGTCARRGLPRRSGQPLSPACAEQHRHPDRWRHDPGQSGRRRGPSTGRTHRPGGLPLGLASVRAPGRERRGVSGADPRRRAVRGRIEGRHRRRRRSRAACRRGRERARSSHPCPAWAGRVVARTRARQRGWLAVTPRRSEAW